MKRQLFSLFTFLLLLLTAATASAQKKREFSIVNFDYDPFDMTAKNDQYKKMDGSGSLYAIIKVSSATADDNLSEYRFNFGNLNHIVEEKENKLWLYVQRNAKHVTISRKGFTTIERYDLGTTIQEGQTYVMTLKAAPRQVLTQNVQFFVQPIDSRAAIMVKASGDNAVEDMLGIVDDSGTIAKSLPYGSYIYKVTAEGYYKSEGYFTLNDHLQTHTEQVVLRSLDDRTFMVEGVQFVMKTVAGGTFKMGSDYSDEKPVHSVTLSSYMIGETEVTQELWQAVMGRNPSKYKGLKKPVERVSWNDCQKFIQKLNELTGQRFRLPTEAEWEYAARGGNRSRSCEYAGSNNISEVAWYTNNRGSEKTHNVKTKAPNELGIYDMSGNVYEWCQDRYDSYSSGAQTNPTGAAAGPFRVSRGGSWFYGARRCSVTCRSVYSPSYSHSNLGLRLVMQFSWLSQ